MSKKVLITGSDGYIGAVMVPMFIESGYEVVGLDCMFYSEGNLSMEKLVDCPTIKKDVRDITEEDLAGEKFDAIVHLAGLSNDPLGKLNSELTYDINYKASVRLAKIAKKVGVKKFIFASSCSLYGQGKEKALTEESASNPQTAYGKSKIMTEEALSELADDDFCPVYMRNATAFGFSPRMRFDLVVNSLCGFAKVDGEIKILGDGTPWRPLVHIKDISGVAIKLIETEDDLIRNQSFNVGDNGENYQIKEIASLVQEFYPDCKITIAQKDAGDTRDYNVSFNKLNSVLNYKSQWPLKEGIREIVKRFNDVKLDRSLFENENFTRLHRIKNLIEQKKLDLNLRRLE
ncbi:SDR family oxidoreductase [Bacteriovoracaceae bacterium]|nr:SDR family oxidoreductase [Bacteriovoracaceae bacterium]